MDGVGRQMVIIQKSTRMCKGAMRSRRKAGRATSDRDDLVTRQVRPRSLVSSAASLANRPWMRSQIDARDARPGIQDRLHAIALVAHLDRQRITPTGELLTNCLRFGPSATHAPEARHPPPRNEGESNDEHRTTSATTDPHHDARSYLRRPAPRRPDGIVGVPAHASVASVGVSNRVLTVRATNTSTAVLVRHSGANTVVSRGGNEWLVELSNSEHPAGRV